jgi:hypothetical protein
MSLRINRAEEHGMQTDEITQFVGTPLTNGQSAKAASLGQTVNQQATLVQGLQLEQKRTVALHGKGSAKAAKVQGLLTAHQNALSRFQTAAKSAQVRAPLANPQEYIIYGYVRDAAGNAAANVDVTVTNDDGAVVQTTTSGNDGWYALHLKSDVPEKACAENEEPSEESPKSRARSSSRSKRSQAPSTELHLWAADKKQTYNVESPSSFQFELGKLAYQDLTVPSAAT